ncbi:hypothetical protein CYMTET_15817, partial [Cymbomonas tetramitiformis]
MYFDATYYVGAPGTVLSGSGDFTVTIWVRTHGAGAQMFLVSQTGEAGQGHYALSMLASGLVDVLTKDTSTRWTATSTTAIDTYTWQHVGMVQSGSLGGGRLYINGALEASSTAGVVNLAAPGPFLGADASGPRHYFVGNLDELGVWSRALPAQDLLRMQLFTEGVLPHDVLFQAQREAHLSSASAGSHPFTYTCASNVDVTSGCVGTCPYLWKSLQECQALCSAHPKCFAMVHDLTGNCYLKEEASPTEAVAAETGTTSCTRFTTETVQYDTLLYDASGECACNAARMNRFTFSGAQYASQAGCSQMCTSAYKCTGMTVKTDGTGCDILTSLTSSTDSAYVSGSNACPYMANGITSTSSRECYYSLATLTVDEGGYARHGTIYGSGNWINQWYSPPP